jgi:hypothetical protein
VKGSSQQNQAIKTLLKATTISSLRTHKPTTTNNMIADQQNQNNGNNDNPQPGLSGSGNNQNQPVVPVDQNPATDYAQQIFDNTNVMLKHEHIIIPDFFGESGKDTITAIDFLTCVNECQSSNNWTDTITYSNFALVLRDSADSWLKALARKLKLAREQKTLT